MDASTIGGTVNIRSLSGFDHDGRSLSLSAEGSYNGLVESTSPKIGGSYTNVFDVGGGEKNLGVALAASWYDREFGSDNIETDGGWPADLELVGGGEFKGAEEIEQRSYDVTRERIGLAANFDFRTDNGEYYLRNLYSDFSDQEYRTRNEWKFDDGDAISGTSTSAQWDGATVEKSMKDRLEEQTILSVLTGGENYVGDWIIDYSYGYSNSEEKEPARLDTEFELEGLSLGYNGVGEKPNLVLDPAMRDASNFTIKEWEALDGTAEDTTNTLKLNFTNNLFDSGYSGNVKFGAMTRTREKIYSGETTLYEGPDGLTAAQFATDDPRYGINEFGPGLDATAIREYFLANRSSLDVADDDSLVASTVDDYTLNEDVVAAYLMSAYEKEDLTVVFGVRYEDTSFDATGARIAIDDVAGSGDPEVRPVSFDNGYGHVLPSINVRWERGDIVLRAAATQSIARPNFDELKPGGEIEFETDDGENELSAEIGNPLLEPIEATNLDFGVEWYPGGVSVVSAGVFYKQLDNFVIYADVADTIDLTQFVGNTQVDDAEVIQPINGDEAELLGFELNFLRQFENGLYLSANGTFVDSEATYYDRTEKTVLPRTPETVLNGAIGWENSDLSFRLAATYRDDALIGLEDLSDSAFDIYQDTHLQLDLSATWNVTNELQLALSAVNLTDEPYYAYFGSRAYNAQFEEYGRTITVGLRYRPY
jgi:TonB-dependent receptor